MEEPLDFEALLNLEIRWPKATDRLFVVSQDWRDNAEIEGGARSRMVLMAMGYKKAADLLVDHTSHDDVAKATLVYPILFNYRHFIELQLKFLIWTYGRAAGIEATWDKHKLEPLWNDVVKVLDSFGIWENNAADRAVGRLVRDFAKVDPRSMAFRYSVGTDGNPMSVELQQLDLLVLRDVMNGLEGWFSGADGYLDHLQSAAS